MIHKLNSSGQEEYSAYSIQVNARHAFLSIARGLDLVGVDDLHHAHRVAYIAYECAKKLQWPQDKIEKTYYSGLIHDCGVSTTKEHFELLHGIDEKNIQYHCIRGYKALKGNTLLDSFADIVRYHHTPFSQLADTNLTQDDQDITALIHLSDRLDFHRCQYVDTDNSEATIHKQKIHDAISSEHGHFSKEQLDCMLPLILLDGFWFAMDYESIESMSQDFNCFLPFQEDLKLAEIKSLADFLAHIVDSKSPYTFQHSHKVAEISKGLASQLGFDDLHCEEIYIAGLLHDVGKLRVPDDILYKEGQLSPTEYAMIKRHSVDTLLTLRQLLPDTKIANWAGNHHERLDGSGYPYHLNEDDLDMESRIIAVADVFQALAEKRPYKERFGADDILEILSNMVAKHKLDNQVFELLKQQKDHYYQVSAR